MNYIFVCLTLSLSGISYFHLCISLTCSYTSLPPKDPKKRHPPPSIPFLTSTDYNKCANKYQHPLIIFVIVPFTILWQKQVMSFVDDLYNGLTNLVGDGRRFKNNSELARHCDVEPIFTHRYLQGPKRGLGAIGSVLDSLGAKLVFPDEAKEDSTVRDICFIDTRIAASAVSIPPPDAEDYVAVPMVGEVGAGAGMIDQGEILSWVLVHIHSLAVHNRSNLLAVEIGKNQRSMEPTLHPMDIILVNRDDSGDTRGFTPPGNIFLVREPGQEGGAMVKRVSITKRKDVTTITFYSDNPLFEPDTYLLSEYDNDLKKAVVGRVVWAWTDLSRK